MRILAVLMICFIVWPALAQSPSQVYARCFGQITGQVVSESSAMWLDVSQGQVSASEACMQALEAALLDSESSMLASDTDLSRNIIANMHRLHHRWFTAADIGEAARGTHTIMRRNAYDNSAPALFYTRALLHPSGRADSLLLRNFNLEPVRSNDDPAIGIMSSISKDETIFGAGIRWAGSGELLGMRVTGNRPTAWEFRGTNGTARLGRTLGGGVIGTPVYLFSSAPAMQPSDGGLTVARSWGKSLYKDLLCRDLPVVRADDARSFVRIESSVPFRKSLACVGCHASMDRASSVIRHMSYSTVGINMRPFLGLGHLQSRAADLPAETVWPAEPDANYIRRPPSGHLFFRNYRGELVDEKVDNIRGLAAAIARQDDFYICLAKRYFDYFTGHDADILEINGRSLSDQAKRIRESVVGFGLELKSHQSIRQLIRGILSNPEYEKSIAGAQK